MRNWEKEEWEKRILESNPEEREELLKLMTKWDKLKPVCMVQDETWSERMKMVNDSLSDIIDVLEVVKDFARNESGEFFKQFMERPIPKRLNVLCL